MVMSFAIAITILFLHRVFFGKVSIYIIADIAFLILHPHFLYFYI